MRIVWSLIVASVLLACSPTPALCLDGVSPSERLARAELLFGERHIEDSLRAAIAEYETLIPTLEDLPLETQRYVLDRLAQLHYEATSFTEGNAPEDRAVFELAADFGFRSLRLNPDYAALEDLDFENAVAHVTDPVALLWTGNSFGATFYFDPLTGMMNVGRLRRIFERSVELDEDYWGASAHAALGALLMTTPGILGGDFELGRRHVERALELHPEYLENHVVRAQYLGFSYDMFGGVNGIRSRRIIEDEASLILAGAVTPWPFWNRQAKVEAEELLDTMLEHLP